MATLKSNSTTAKALFVWLGDDGHVNKVNGAASSVVGTVPQGTRDGHVSYGGGVANGNYMLTTSLAEIPVGASYAVLIIGHFGFDVRVGSGRPYWISPRTSTYATGYDPSTTRSVQSVSSYLGPSGTWAPLTDNNFPSSTVYTLIGGRTTAGAQKTYVNGVATTHATNINIANENVPAGQWRFGGSPWTGSNAGFDTTLFAIFSGVSPDELATYLGSNPYTALFDFGPTTIVGSSAQTVNTTGSATGTVVGPRQFASSKTLAFSGTATAKIKQRGSSTASLLTSGTATGKVKERGASIAALLMSGSSTGTIATGGLASFNTPPITNNTGTLLSGISGWYVNVYNATTGAFVVKKTGLSSDVNGVISVSDATLVAGTSYSYEVGHATYGRRLPLASAA